MMISIWMQGYKVTGNSSTAQYLGRFDCESFDEAVKEYNILHPGEVELNRGGEGIHCIWGCRLFDNEQDARRIFG